VFKAHVNLLQSVSPPLNREETMYCCLSRLHLSTAIIGYCLENVDTDAVKQRKYRIKRKMRKSQNMKLFDFFFEKM
jgi:hypothetical protein